MTPIWILIVFFQVNSAGGAVSQEFLGEKACREALATVQQMHPFKAGACVRKAS